MLAGPAPARARLALELLRAEGWRGLLARALDRAAEARRERSFRPLRPGEPAPRAAVLNLLPTRPLAELGGVQVQLRERLEQERRQRPVALLHPARQGFRLELQEGPRRAALALPGDPATARGWLGALRSAREVTGARLLHVENLAGLPVALLRDLAQEPPRLVVSLHDLGAACLRVLLGGAPDPACSLARGGPPCGGCPRGPGTSVGSEAPDARSAAAAVLARASALVLPSELLRRRLGEVFPALAEVELLPPARTLPSLPPRAPGTLRHAVFVGSAHPHKGAAVLSALLEARSVPGLRWSALGGGPPAWQDQLRRRGVAVHGRYRDGSLPARLRSLQADLVLLLSVWPESWGLTLDESWAAGVPALLFDGGAPAERVRALGGGRVVPLAEGAAGLARALLELRGGLPQVPAPERRPDLSPERAARQLGALYERLLA